MTHFCLIAGEPSGDLLGARLIAALRRHAGDGQMSFSGIGGERMIGEGMHSIFPYHELALMGFAEILPHIFRLKRRIRQTVEHIVEQKPDVVITIDSPGFCFRVIEQLRQQLPPDQLPKLVHYVAPTVWAYKPKRALKVKKLYDLLLLLLPFEPPYFEAVAMPHRFIGHPIVREWHEQPGESQAFRNQHGILPNAPILTLLPGSRRTELKRHLPIFCEVATRLSQRHPQLTTVMVTPPYLEAEVKAALAHYPGHMVITSDLTQKRNIFAASTVALAKSGTVTLELSLARVPMVVTYKVSAISAWLMKRMIQVPYVNLLNLIAGKEIIPELLQERCTVPQLVSALEALLSSKESRQTQREAAAAALAQLDDTSNPTTPSDKAAEAVFELVSDHPQHEVSC